VLLPRRTAPGADGVSAASKKRPAENTAEPPVPVVTKLTVTVTFSPPARLGAVPPAPGHGHAVSHAWSIATLDHNQDAVCRARWCAWPATLSTTTGPTSDRLRRGRPRDGGATPLSPALGVHPTVVRSAQPVLAATL
jgi:hypothetical protein